jgi:DnaJ-class molecular chaperone
VEHGARPTGAHITQTIDSTGSVSDNPALRDYNVTDAHFDEVTEHNIASVFWSFMSDIFENFFGETRRGRGSSRERGADLRYNLEITLEDAFHGKTATIKIPTSVTCEVCSGSGAKAGSKPRQCPTCGGYGRVRAAQGFFSIERTCPNCHGRGEVIDDPCEGCGGGA